MVNLPCRELLLQLQQGVALGKGRSAPNASPSRDCPRRCTRDQSLDPLSPRPKGSEGWAVPPPAGFSVSAPSPSRVKMNGLRPPLTASRLGLCR